MALTPAAVRLARDKLGSVGPVLSLGARRRLAGFWISRQRGGARQQHLGVGELLILGWFTMVKPG